jgi:hypothetical protein
MKKWLVTCAALAAQARERGNLMSRNSVPLVVVGLVAAALSAGAAHAQQVSSTNDYTLSWTGSAFGSASTVYAVEEAYGTTPFDFGSFELSLYSDATNLTLNNAGGITVNFPSLTPSPPYSNPTTVVFSSDGTLGSWGATYNTADPVTLGTLGSLPTLTFTAYDGEDISGIYYYVYAYLPGDWTTEGTSPGDYTNVSVGAGFSTPTFTYSNGVTTVVTSTADYTGTHDNLSFTLIGSAIPEPSTWAMLLLGFAGLGFLAYRKRATLAAT